MGGDDSEDSPGRGGVPGTETGPAGRALGPSPFSSPIRAIGLPIGSVSPSWAKDLGQASRHVGFVGHVRLVGLDFDQLVANRDLSPICFSQLRIVPSSIESERRGITTSLIGQLHAYRLTLRPAALTGARAGRRASSEAAAWRRTSARISSITDLLPRLQPADGGDRLDVGARFRRRASPTRLAVGEAALRRPGRSAGRGSRRPLRSGAGCRPASARDGWPPVPAQSGTCVPGREAANSATTRFLPLSSTPPTDEGRGSSARPCSGRRRFRRPWRGCRRGSRDSSGLSFVPASKTITSSEGS